jgi:hypothetical protein
MDIFLTIPDLLMPLILLGEDNALTSFAKSGRSFLSTEFLSDYLAAQMIPTFLCSLSWLNSRLHYIHLS